MSKLKSIEALLVQEIKDLYSAETQLVKALPKMAEVIDEDGESSVKDLALIVAAQKVEHYEMAGYGSARTLAEVLGYEEAVELLQATLDEEGETDKKLTKLSLRLIPQAGAIAA